jgi:hypothetical protein
MNTSSSQAPRHSGSNPSLWRRITLQSDALSALYRVADFHASIAKYLGIEDPVAGLKLSVTITNLDLQIAESAADATFPIRWNLQSHLPLKTA